MFGTHHQARNEEESFQRYYDHHEHTTPYFQSLTHRSLCELSKHEIVARSSVRRCRGRDGLWFFTFHSAGAKWLRERPERQWRGVFMVVVVPLETLFLMTSLMVCAEQLCHRCGQMYTNRNSTAQWGESKGESKVWVFRLSCGLRALPLSLPTDVAVEIRMSPAKHQIDRPQPRALKLRGAGGKGHDVLRGVGDLWNGHRRRRVAISLSQEGVRPER